MDSYRIHEAQTKYELNDLIIIGSKREELDGSISVYRPSPSQFILAC